MPPAGRSQRPPRRHQGGPIPNALRFWRLRRVACPAPSCSGWTGAAWTCPADACAFPAKETKKERCRSSRDCSRRSTPCASRPASRPREQSPVDGLGRPLQQSALQAWLNKWPSAAGLRDDAGNRYMLHSFRRYAGKRWLDGGLNIREVALLYGHSDIAVTMRYLCYDFEEVQRHAARVDFGLGAEAEGQSADEGRQRQRQRRVDRFGGHQVSRKRAGPRPCRSPVRPRHGAQVALLRCPILRDGSPSLPPS